MKKRFISLFLLLSLAICSANVALADGSPQVLKPEVSPVMVNGTTLVPVRVLAEWMGFKVQFDPNTQTVIIGDMQLYQNTGTNSDSFAYPVAITIGNMTATVKGVKKELDVPAIVWNGSTLLPLRFVSESLGAKVTWNGSTKQITFDYQNKEATLSVPTQSDQTTARLQTIVKPLIQKHQFEKAALKGPSYLELAASPSKYKGAPDYFSGQVFQAIEDNKGATLLLLDISYGNTSQQLVAVMSSSRMDDVKEGDFVDVYGTCSTPFTYKTQAGTSNTVPALTLVTYNKIKVTADSGSPTADPVVISPGTSTGTQPSSTDTWSTDAFKQMKISLSGDNLILTSGVKHATDDIQISSIQIEDYSYSDAPVVYSVMDYYDGKELPLSSFKDTSGNAFSPVDQQSYFVKVVSQFGELDQMVTYSK